jgi:hypothetical protein
MVAMTETLSGCPLNSTVVEVNPPVEAASLVFPELDAGGLALSSISIVRMFPLSVVFITVSFWVLGLPISTPVLPGGFQCYILLSPFRLMLELLHQIKMVAIGKITWF